MTFDRLIKIAKANPALAFHRVEDNTPATWFLWFDGENANQLCMGPKDQGRKRINMPDSYDVPMGLFLHDLVTDEWQIYWDQSA